MFRWRRYVDRFDAWVVRLLLQPPRATRVVITSIVIYAAIRIPVLSGLRYGEDLFMDSTEAYALGQQFLGGYGRHPPLTGWIAGLWFRVFPAANWASYALSSVMTAVSLVSIYFIAKRVLDARRAVFIVFVMMLYPLFHIKANRFSNYQLLLALMPLLVLVFLIAYEKRTALWGAALGLVAAAATLTIYSGLLGLLAIGVAAVVHPACRRFLRSPAPYVATVVYLLAVSPHAVWLLQSHFASISYAEQNISGAGTHYSSLHFLAHHAGLLAIPIAGGALALWRWRLRPPGKQRPDRLLVIIIAVVLVATAPLIVIPLHAGLKPDWGNPLFFLIPLTVLALMPRILVTRRAVASIAIIAAAWVIVLIAGASAASWLKSESMELKPQHWAYSQLAGDLTDLWRQRFHTPMPIVIGTLPIASAVTFYSPDHPRMLVDFNPAYSPWIDFPSDLRRGFIGVCAAEDANCLGYLDGLHPGAERTELTVMRKLGGVSRTVSFHIRIAAPAP